MFYLIQCRVYCGLSNVPLKMSDKIKQVQLLTWNKLMFMYVKAELVSQFSKFHVSL